MSAQHHAPAAPGSRLDAFHRDVVSIDVAWLVPDRRMERVLSVGTGDRIGASG